MNQLKRNNHFVSKMYLKNWGDDQKRIWEYRLLVPRTNFPNWKHQAIEAITSQRDLYTVIENGEEDDSFERWIESEFETPTKESLSKVINDKKLTLTDWNRLALFFGLQDVRTPISYIESMERWSKTIPQVIENSLNNSIRILEEHHREGTPIPNRSLEQSSESNFFGASLNITINPHAIPEKNLGEISAEITTGRKFWVGSIRYLLNKTAKVLLTHKWSIVEPADGMSWFTSDHPALRLNYYGDGSYNLNGGWGRVGGNLIMPLSPKHLLFTQIGSESNDKLKFSTDKTYEIQKFLAERAYRSIFAHKKLPGILRLRQRIANLQQFVYEEELWKNWHEEQSLVEIKKHKTAGNVN